MGDENSGTATVAVAPARAESIRTGGTNDGPSRLPRIPLGAELPIFCERCGYSLNALPQVRCDHCTVLQFHCPECGHHQPINTLRPAMQRTLGRVPAALFIGLLAFFKLNWFGWHLFFWMIMGHGWAYSYNYRTQAMESLSPSFESVLAFTIYGTIVGFTSRLLLLRWRSGALVGTVLGALVCTTLVAGFNWRIADNVRYGNTGMGDALMTPGRAFMTLLTFIVIALSAAAAWPIWVGFVRVAMPERAGSVLLEWQRSLSDPTEKARLSDQP